MKTIALTTLSTALLLPGCHRNEAPPPQTPLEAARQDDAAAAREADPHDAYTEEELYEKEKTANDASAADAVEGSGEIIEQADQSETDSDGDE